MAMHYQRFDDSFRHNTVLQLGLGRTDRQTDRHTDRQTDRQKWLNNIALCMTCDKKIAVSRCRILLLKFTLNHFNRDTAPSDHARSRRGSRLGPARGGAPPSSPFSQVRPVLLRYTYSAVVKVREFGGLSPLLPFEPPPRAIVWPPDWIYKVLFYA